MSIYWTIDGSELNTATTRISPLPGMTHTTRVRQSLLAIHGGTEHRERLGRDLAKGRLEMRFWGQGTDKFDEAATVYGIMSDNDSFTLGAPDDLDIFVFKNHKRANASAVNSPTLDYDEGTGRITLKVEYIINGVYIGDGGTFVECINGEVEFLENEYFSTVGALGESPTIWLPEQTVGYPKAINNSTFAEETLTATGTDTVACEDGSTATIESFDLTNYIHPALASEGDSGLFTIKSSPTSDALDCA